MLHNHDIKALQDRCILVLFSTITIINHCFSSTTSVPPVKLPLMQSSAPVPPIKPKSQLPSPRHNQPLPVPNGASQKPLPNLKQQQTQSNSSNSNLPIPTSTNQNAAKSHQQTYRYGKPKMGTPNFGDLS